MGNTKKSNLGRKSLYDKVVKPNLDKIVEWAAAGMTDADIMKNLGIGRTAEDVLSERLFGSKGQVMI
jgi:hypothetical protein